MLIVTDSVSLVDVAVERGTTFACVGRLCVWLMHVIEIIRLVGWRNIYESSSKTSKTALCFIAHDMSFLRKTQEEVSCCILCERLH